MQKKEPNRVLGSKISKGFYVSRPPMRSGENRTITPLIDWIKK